MIALAAGVAFYLRQRRAQNPLYDLDVAGRRVFWVAACAGIIVFGSLMGATFISQQFLQNVLGYSTLEAGLSIMPAAALMVLVAPRSAKLVDAHGARFTLLGGYVFLLLAFPRRCSSSGRRTSPYWQVALALCIHRDRSRARGHAGLALADELGARYARRDGVRHRRPAARPRRRNHAVDLRRAADGGICDGHGGRRSPPPARTSPTASQSQLTKSFAGAEDVAEQHPQYADQITAAAKTSFLEGDQWAYTAGIVAIVLGAALVFFLFPKKEEEEELLAAYHAEDASQDAGSTATSLPKQIGLGAEPRGSA